MAQQLVVGTRGSALAVTRTRVVVEALNQILADDDFSPLEIQTLSVNGALPNKLSNTANNNSATGDNSGAIVTTSLRSALASRHIDLAVHSATDLPNTKCNGSHIISMPWRASTHDTLCSIHEWTLDTLPKGATIGTNSPRRAAQVRAYRNDLQIKPIYGDVERRLSFLTTPPKGEKPVDAIIVAEAELQSLGTVQNEILDYVSQVIPYCIMLPDPGQGALALEVRNPETEDDANPQYQALIGALEKINDPGTLLAVTAERAMVEALEANSSTPVAGYAWHQPSSAGVLLMHAEVFTPEGRRIDTLGDIRLPAPEWNGRSRCGWGITQEMSDAAKSLGTALADDLYSQGYEDPRS